MTGRERTLAALNHTEADRIPLDLGATESSGVTVLKYRALTDEIGIGGAVQIFDPYQQLAKIEEPVLRHFGVDTCPVLIEPKKWKPALLDDGSPCEIPAGWNEVERADGAREVLDADGRAVARKPSASFYFDPVNPPLAGVSADTLDPNDPAIRSYDWPGWADETSGDIAARAMALRAETDCALVGNLQIHILAAAQILHGYEDFMMDLALDPGFVHKLFGALVEGYKKRLDDYLPKVGPHLDVILVNDDLGTQQGPMMSLEMYRELLLPYQKELFGYIKKRFEGFLLLHSCGSVVACIPDLIEAGIDALNPVQVSAAGMDSKELKKKFGNDLTFWGGGCDTQRVLCKGTKQEVFDEVKRRIDDFAPGGGFVFTQVHNIQPDVPVKNILWMYEAFHRFAGY